CGGGGGAGGEERQRLTSAQEIRIRKTAPGWRNWQTRTVEGRVGQPMRVQIPPRAPDKPETALQKGFWPAGQGVATDSATNSPAGRGPHKRTRLLKEQIAVAALFLLQDRGHFHRGPYLHAFQHVAAGAQTSLRLPPHAESTRFPYILLFPPFLLFHSNPWRYTGHQTYL